MKAGAIFSGSGPNSIPTTGKDLEGEKVASWLGNKGIKKYIAYEVDLDRCKRCYGNYNRWRSEKIHVIVVHPRTIPLAAPRDVSGRTRDERLANSRLGT
jgi:hypothetical protein